MDFIELLKLILLLFSAITFMLIATSYAAYKFKNKKSPNKNLIDSKSHNKSIRSAVERHLKTTLNKITHISPIIKSNKFKIVNPNEYSIYKKDELKKISVK
jgi:hypothetical protein